MNLFSVWNRIKAMAACQGSNGYAMSIFDARFIVVRLCREEQVPFPPADALEFLASELVRLTLDAYDGEPRLRLRPSYREYTDLLEGVSSSASR